MNAEDKVNEMLKHSFLIMYSEDKQKWCVECSLLKITLHADTYREALFLTAKAMLEYNLSKEFSDLIEQDKKDHMKD